MGKNSGRSTTSGPKAPYYSESDIREAAKHLRLTSGRYLYGRATSGDVDEAIRIWQQAGRKSK